MKIDKEQGIRVLKRAFKLRCPACGESSIVERPFHIRHHCPVCLALYKREDGFFVGAILANVVITELVILAFCFFCLLVIGAKYESVLGGPVYRRADLPGRFLPPQLELMARFRLFGGVIA